ncbi:ferric reduction oxidase 7, chloroplastic [Jatropha curcas]|nr:ferric reduction oxidase 7, chloroplastic [Jatropha curcas]
MTPDSLEAQSCVDDWSKAELIFTISPQWEYQPVVEITIKVKWVKLLQGGMFLVFSGPILVITFLSAPYLIISSFEEKFKWKKKGREIPRYKLWTFPVVVGGPLGVVCGGEAIGILVFIVYIIWAVYAHTVRNLKVAEDSQFTQQQQKISLVLELTGLSFGSIGIFCLAFLFIPVARGSFLLQLINIPFEHAVRYHVWLGHLTMVMFTFHGLFYVIAWAREDCLLTKILEWENNDIANLAGVISLMVGFLMWITALYPVRNKSFELFFYIHQLYPIFLIFMALHTSDNFFGIAAGGIFLFMLDRFLRFWQSRKTVDIISATYLPCGTIKFIISKSKNLHYNTLSFVFLKVNEISWLQWHPFSVSSSPRNGESHFSLLIKVCGGWTMKITASIEGPYGHAISYHLMYENLVLVAGGIGISPFLAILSDILHHIKQKKACVSTNVLIIWATKRSNEIALLSTIDLGSLSPTSLCNELNLEIIIHVTGESEPPLEEGEIASKSSAFVYKNGTPIIGSRCDISSLIGHKKWSGLYVILTTIGFVLLESLVNTFYIKPLIIPLGWYSGLIFLTSMAMSVVIFGGIIVGLWHFHARKYSTAHKEDDGLSLCYDNNVELKDGCQEKLANFMTIQYGSRPNFKDILAVVSKCWGYVDVGVPVCGPPSLGSSVAKECRSLNMQRQGHHPIFHYHSHSFEF